MKNLGFNSQPRRKGTYRIFMKIQSLQLKNLLMSDIAKLMRLWNMLFFVKKVTQ